MNLCPSCHKPLELENCEGFVIIWCGNGKCPAGSTSNDGASAQTVEQAYRELEKLIEAKE